MRRWALAACALTMLVTHPVAAQRRFTQTQRCTALQRATGCLLVLGTGMPVPDPEHSGPAYAIVFGDRVFLIDAGAGVMRRAAAAGLPIDGFTRVLITHLHSDHTLGLPDVLLTTWVMGRRSAMTVIGPPGLRAMTDHLFAAWQEDITIRTDGLEQGQRDGHRATIVETTGGVVYDSMGVRITAVRVPHGDWSTAFAYVVTTPTRKFVLSGDTALSDALADAARDADVLVHETYTGVRLQAEARPGGDAWPRYMHAFHTSDVEVGTLANRAGIKLLVLSHIVRMGGTNAELIAGVRKGGYMGSVVIARDLDVY